MTSLKKKVVVRVTVNLFVENAEDLRIRNISALAKWEQTGLTDVLGKFQINTPLQNVESRNMKTYHLN